MDDPNDFIRGVSLKRNGSLVCPHPSILIEGITRKSFAYKKLPQEPLNLTVIKLDGSSFGIEVPKMGTLARIKEGVEAAFSHMPKNGPETISWPHVWGNFCLSYKGQHLLNDSDHVLNYGIKDGDKLHFVRRGSPNGKLIEMIEMPAKGKLIEKPEEDSDIDEITIPEGSAISLLYPQKARHHR